VAHREANGPYQEVEDLLEVSGIGEAKLASIRDLIVVP
jgi:competence protein ComEA